jgi:hypothetical protein
MARVVGQAKISASLRLTYDQRAIAAGRPTLAEKEAAKRVEQEARKALKERQRLERLWAAAKPMKTRKRTPKVGAWFIPNTLFERVKKVRGIGFTRI